MRRLAALMFVISLSNSLFGSDLSRPASGASEDRTPPAFTSPPIAGMRWAAAEVPSTAASRFRAQVPTPQPGPATPLEQTIILRPTVTPAAMAIPQPTPPLGRKPGPAPTAWRTWDEWQNKK